SHLGSYFVYKDLVLGNILSVRALLREGAGVRFEGEGVHIQFSNRQEGVGRLCSDFFILDDTRPLSDAIGEDGGEGGVEDGRTPYYAMARMGEGVSEMSSERGGDISVRVPENHGRCSSNERNQLKNESASEKANVTLTKGHIERIEAIVGDESDQAHHCAAADGPETPISRLPRQIESLVKRDGGNTHGHEPMRSHDRKTTQIAANIDVAANIVDTRTQRMNRESNFDLPSIFQAHKASDDAVNAYDGRSDGGFDGVIDGSFGRGYESGEGVDSDVGRRLSSDLWNCQSGEQCISEHGRGGIIGSPMLVSCCLLGV
ncbi:hypothetical protein FRC11_002694, partial [Ceratobasidium sp. 423]